MQGQASGGAGGGRAERRFFAPGKLYRLRKAVTLGVDIGPRHLRMAKVVRLGEKKHHLMGLKVVELPKELSRGSEAFSLFLKEAVEAFCGPQDTVEIWTVMSAARIDIRHIRIPKVPKKQIANAVYWTAKKDSSLDEKEVVFDFEVQEEIVDQGVNKYSVLILTAPRQDVEDIRNLFARAGLTLAGVTIAPFAVQNLFRTGWAPGSGSAVASLYIGRDHSRIDIFSRGNLVMNRGDQGGLEQHGRGAHGSVQRAPEDVRRRGSARSRTGSDAGRGAKGPDEPRRREGRVAGRRCRQRPCRGGNIRDCQAARWTA